MSSGDYLRYLRALKGGPDLITVGQESGVAPHVLREIEQRYRPIGDQETLTKLAHYYGVPPEELIWRHEWSRKSLSRALEAAQQQDYPLRVHLRTGEAFQGKVIWWDLGAVLLELEDGRQLVVQRHIIETWDPRADGIGA
ncbi:MAG: hypothetical protein RML36_11685 [Anaerolineae bacterium]|nr:helix-turn-helix transcriptional regulator [Anaerolineae bacterium]MDW8100129.1 hypothetical protein [Anaerolineae bacterium]